MGLDGVGFEASRREVMLGILSSLWKQQRMRNMSELLGIDWMFLIRESMVSDALGGVYKNRTIGDAIMVITRADNTI